MMGRRKKIKMRLMGILRRWHRVMGVSVMIFAVYLAVTGILLNHSHSLGLDTIMIRNSLILNLYGVKASAPHEGFRVGDHWISYHEKRIFFDHQYVTEASSAVVGAIVLADNYWVATGEYLFHLDRRGLVNERVGQELGLPGEIKRLGTLSSDCVIQVDDTWYRADPDHLDWHTVAEGNIVWSTPHSLPEALEGQLKIAYGGEGFSLERILLDFHSGRIFKSLGVWVTDLIAICIILISLSGLGIFLLPKMMRDSPVNHPREDHH